MFKNFFKFKSEDSASDNFMTVPVYVNKQERDKALEEDAKYEYIVENPDEYIVDLSKIHDNSSAAKKLPFFLSIKEKLEAEFCVETTAA